MPTSLLALAPKIVTLIDQAPGGRNILDIGPGHGKYGLLCREYLNPKPTRLVAVEAHRPYLAEWGTRLRAIYDEVYLANGLDLGTGPLDAHYLAPELVVGCPTEFTSAIYPCALEADFLGWFDVVLLLDVIEHFPKDEALALLDRIPGRIIINTPVEFFVSVPGHPTEEHVSHWTLEDFEALGRPVEHGDIEMAGVTVQLGPKS